MQNQVLSSQQIALLLASKLNVTATELQNRQSKLYLQKLLTYGKLNHMKLKPGLDIFCAIQPKKEIGPVLELPGFAWRNLA